MQASKFSSYGYSSSVDSGWQDNGTDEDVMCTAGNDYNHLINTTTYGM